MINEMSSKAGRLIRIMNGLPEYEDVDGITDVELTNIGIIPSANNRYSVGILNLADDNTIAPHEPRINFGLGSDFNNKSFSITIENPHLVAGKCDLTDEELNKLYKWIKYHQDLLLYYWNHADRISITKVMNDLKAPVNLESESEGYTEQLGDPDDRDYKVEGKSNYSKLAEKNPAMKYLQDKYGE